MIFTVLNLFALLLRTIIEEKRMLMSVFGSAVFQIHVFPFGLKVLLSARFSDALYLHWKI